MCVEHFTCLTSRQNALRSVIKEPFRANVEPILLLPFNARSYERIIPHQGIHDYISPLKRGVLREKFISKGLPEMATTLRTAPFITISS